MCSDRRKNHGCGRKKPKSTSSAIFGVETACEMLWTQAVCRPSSQQNRQDKFELFAWTLSPNFFSPKLNFSPSTKKTTEYSFELFFPLTIFFYFCCLCLSTTRVTMQFRAKNTGFSTGLYPVYATPYWWSCGADGRTDGHVAITSLPKFLGWMAG